VILILKISIMKVYKGGKAKDDNESIDPNLLATIRKVEKEQHRKVVANTDGPKYSTMLLDLIKPFHTEVTPFDEMQALLDLAAIGWNLSNIKKMLPHAYNVMWKEIKNDYAHDKLAIEHLQKIIKQKQQHFDK